MGEILHTTHFTESVDSSVRHIRAGNLVILPFNGVYGIFGRGDNEDVAEAIYEVKNRPQVKKLVIVATPERLRYLVDSTNFKHHPIDRFINLLRNPQTTHALGLILPASAEVRDFLTSRKDGIKTFVNIWTEYPFFRGLLQELEKVGIMHLVGTSANTSGDLTHFEAEAVIQDFQQNKLISAIVTANFDHLEAKRYRSTTIVDLTNEVPRVHRIGNMDIEEIRRGCTLYGIDNPIVDDKTIIVEPRMAERKIIAA